MKHISLKMLAKSAAFAMGVVLLATGCKDEPTTVVPNDDDKTKVSLEASLEVTRTHLNEEYAVIWDANDKITVFGSEDGYATVNKETFAMTAGANTATATFEGFLPEAAEGTKFYATYPDCWESPTRVEFPTVQKYAEGTFSNNTSPMIASFVEGAEAISFRNPFGIIELSLSGEGTVSSIKLSDANYAAPASADTALLDIDPETLAISTAVNDLTITLQNVNVTLGDTAQSFFIVVPPTTFEALRVDVACADGSVVTRTAGEAVTVGRNQIVPLKEIVISSEPVMERSEWSLVGTFNEWKPENGTAMYVVDGYHVAYNVALSSTDDFKFVKVSGDAQTWIGGLSYSKIDRYYATSKEGNNNISAAAPGTYDIYLNAAADTYYIMSSGKLPSEAVADVPVFDANTWYLMGDFVGDVWHAGFTMTQQGSYYVAEDIAFANRKEEGLVFKVRKGDSWYGCTLEKDDKQVAKPYALNSEIALGGEDNILIGGEVNVKYDFYLDVENMMVWVMADGQKPVVTWTLKGNFEGNNWAEDVTATLVDGYYVAEDVVFAAGEQGAEFKVLRNGKWLGAKSDAKAELHTAISFAADGDKNIAVNAVVGEKYDIYIDTVGRKVWVMVDGCKPGDAIPTPPVPDGTTAGATTEQYERGEIVDPDWN